MHWTALAFLSGLSFSIMATIMVFVAQKTSPEQTLFWVTFSIAIFYLVYTYYNGKSIFLDKKVVFILLIASIFSFLGNLFNLTAQVKSSNPAYAGQIKNISQVILFLIFSVLFLNKEMSLVKVIGILISLLGLALIVL